MCNKWGTMMVVLIVTGGLALAQEDEAYLEILDQLKHNPTSQTSLGLLKQELGKITNRTERCRVELIYGLGAIVAGDSKEGKAVLQQVQATYKSEETAQFVGSLEEPCKTCGGDGICTVDCVQCKGSGQCKACGGNGVSKTTGIGGSSVQCTLCHGKGICKGCNGTKEFKEKCLKCAGAGKIRSMDKIKAAYQKLLKASRPPN